MMKVEMVDWGKLPRTSRDLGWTAECWSCCRGHVREWQMMSEGSVISDDG